MIRKLLAILAIGLPGLPLIGTAADWLPVEQEVKQAVDAKTVTIVHFWAPWCPNCTAEKKDNGWAGFIDRNPAVKFVFVEIWNDGNDSRDALARYNIGTQPNFTALAHPGPRGGEGQMKSFMGLAVTSTPTTWIWRDGKLRFAFNYGEIRFPILQQLVDDTTRNWSRDS